MCNAVSCLTPGRNEGGAKGISKEVKTQTNPHLKSVFTAGNEEAVLAQSIFTIVLQTWMSNEPTENTKTVSWKLLHLAQIIRVFLFH